MQKINGKKPYKEYYKMYYREHKQDYIDRSRKYRNTKDFPRRKGLDLDKNRLTKKRYKEKQKDKWQTFIKSLGYTQCVRCGYDKCHQALHFHHKDLPTKEFNIATFIKG